MINLLMISARLYSNILYFVRGVVAYWRRGQGKHFTNRINQLAM